MLDEEQVKFAIECFSEWAQLRGDSLHDCPDFEQLSADIEHSSLLHRLLNGNLPLEDTPPLRYGYPDYALGRGEQVRIFELMTIEEGSDKGMVIVDQCGDWRWSDRENGVLWHMPSGNLYQLSGKPKGGYGKIGLLDDITLHHGQGSEFNLQKIKP